MFFVIIFKGMAINLLFGLVTSIVFLFVFWRKLKEDYVADQIFSTGFYIITGIVVGVVVSVNFKPAWWFWSGLSGALLGLSIAVERYKLRLFEVLEASVNGGIILMASYFLLEWIKVPGTYILVMFLSMLFLILLFEFLNLHYKRFSWYKSGRVGFTGLTISGIFFLLRAVGAGFFPITVSFVGKSDVILSGIFAFISFISVYNLSRASS